VADSPPRDDEQSGPGDEHVEELARQLAEQLRNAPNRQELTEYAISLLKESAEEADQAEQAERSVARASRGDPFNPIAFGIPLFVIGAVLCATGILIGPGLGVMGIAVLMVVYGVVVSLFTRRRRGRDASGSG
jgi:hypothetical protein